MVRGPPTAAPMKDEPSTRARMRPGKQVMLETMPVIGLPRYLSGRSHNDIARNRACPRALGPTPGAGWITKGEARIHRARAGSWSSDVGVVTLPSRARALTRAVGDTESGLGEGGLSVRIPHGSVATTMPAAPEAR